MTAFLDAVRAGDREEVERLLAADPAAAEATEAGVSAPLLALYHGRRELAELLARARSELGVFEAAALDRTGRVEELLDADPGEATAFSADGFTALHLAAFFGAPDAAAVLVGRGADVRAVSRNALRVQPLHSAAAARQVEIARLLLDAGADPNAAQEGGFVPLDAALQNEDRELEALLRGRGARPSR
ncbi:MAG TPA: ankyrin repeat domain-containing protein [Gaiellaceae bacterium]|nr:ankyrin repeat domain-containing protein [Gaiellaceae bacterium]